MTSESRGGVVAETTWKPERYGGDNHHLDKDSWAATASDCPGAIATGQVALKPHCNFRELITV